MSVVALTVEEEVAKAEIDEPREAGIEGGGTESTGHCLDGFVVSLAERPPSRPLRVSSQTAWACDSTLLTTLSLSKGGVGPLRLSGTLLFALEPLDRSPGQVKSAEVDR